MKKLIVDVNVFNLFFKDSQFKPAYKAVEKGLWCISYTNTAKFNEDYRTVNQDCLKLFLELGRSGKSIKEDSEKINANMSKSAKTCKSNDPHIVALAQISGARLLCSHDKELGEDFMNSTTLLSFLLRKSRVFQRYPQSQI